MTGGRSSVRVRTDTIAWLLRKGMRMSPWRLAVLTWWYSTSKARKRRTRRHWARVSCTPPENMPNQFAPALAGQLWMGVGPTALWRTAGECFEPEVMKREHERAENAASGVFDLLGSGPISVGNDCGEIAWHRDFVSGAEFPADLLFTDVPIWTDNEGADIKVPWELSRFQHVFAFLWTDPDRYGPVFVAQWQDWRKANPLARGVNWACTMDVALRAVAWSVAVACWWNGWPVALQQQMWADLVDHARFIRNVLEWSPYARTNHYYSDLVGLATVAVTLNESSNAREWLQFARRELERETLSQFDEDGMNRECSSAYHRLMVELATIGARACEVGGVPFRKCVVQRIAQAYRCAAVLSGANGEYPLFGDNDSGRVFATATRSDRDVRFLFPIGRRLTGQSDLPTGTISPEYALLFGHDRGDDHGRYVGNFIGPEPPQSIKRAGIYVLGNADDRLIIRCGPLYRPVGGHRHLDQLTFVLQVDGHEILVDPGQVCYTAHPARRDYFRSSAAHNSVVIDGELQCRVHISGKMTYSIIDESKPRVCEWRSDATEIVFCGRHSGYGRLVGGGDHERKVTFSSSRRSWRVVDRLSLTGEHRIEWHFQLHPEATAVEVGSGWQFTRGKSVLTLVWGKAKRPEMRVVAAHYAQAYGCEVSSRALVCSGDFSGPVNSEFELIAGDRS